jgi:hypothetical protein
MRASIKKLKADFILIKNETKNLVKVPLIKY